MIAEASATAVLIHGVARAGAPPPADAPPHERAPLGALVVLVSPSGLVGAPGEDAGEALRHNAILRAYALAGGVMPVRLGAAASSAAAAAASLAPRAAAFARALDRLDGAVEYGAMLTAAPGAGAAAPARAAPEGGGRDWLRARLAQRQRVEAGRGARAAHIAQVAAQVIAPVRSHARLHGRDPLRLLDLALLCAPAGREDLLDAARVAGDLAARAGLRLAISGPWPAYAFADALMEDAHDLAP